MKVSETQSRNKHSASTVSGSKNKPFDNKKHASDLRLLIEEAAYHDALTRGSAAAYDRDDWFATEKEKQK